MHWHNPAKSHLALLLPLAVLGGCIPHSNYVSPDSTVPKASAKLEFHSSFPISVAYVNAFYGEHICGQPVQNPILLFRRARGNPLIPDENVDGLSLAAGKPINIAARAFATVSAQCEAQIGTLVPRAGVQYTFRLSQGTTCELEILEGPEQQPSADYSPLECKSQQ